MKFAGTNRKEYGQKLTASNYSALAGSRLSPAETVDSNHKSLAVREEAPPDFDDYDVFAPTRGIDSHLSAEDQKMLDAMLARAGLRNILHALGLLMESRVDENFLQNGMLILHLARENDFARAAEQLHNLALHPSIKDVSL